jgi:hypothetical protein
MVAVLSDLYCDPEAMIARVRPLAFQGHDVVLFQLLDPHELAPPLRAATVLEDMESGEAVEVSPDFAQREYPERVRRHIARLRDAAAAIRADHVLLDTSMGLEVALRGYLQFRERRR